MKIVRSHGHETIIIKLKREFPTTEEVIAWLDMIDAMRANHFLILGEDVDVESLHHIQHMVQA